MNTFFEIIGRLLIWSALYVATGATMMFFDITHVAWYFSGGCIFTIFFGWLITPTD